MTAGPVSKSPQITPLARPPGAAPSPTRSPPLAQKQGSSGYVWFKHKQPCYELKDETFFDVSSNGLHFTFFLNYFLQP